MVVVEGGEVLLQLEGRVELRATRLATATGKEKVREEAEGARTSLRGTSGGPAAKSSALVPGWMRLFAFMSTMFWSMRTACASRPGDWGPVWSSAGGGGLGSRGELGGRAMASLCGDEAAHGSMRLSGGGERDVFFGCRAAVSC